MHEVQLFLIKFSKFIEFSNFFPFNPLLSAALKISLVLLSVRHKLWA